MAGSALGRQLRERVASLRFNRAEAGGALGDLGTFLPLLIGLVTACGLNLGHALLFAGLSSVAAGLVFGIPMPIQPMKAIAVVAIAESLPVAAILAAGILSGAAIFALGASGLTARVQDAVPRPLVRAIQLALGIELLRKGFRMSVLSPPWLGADSVVLAALAVMLVVGLRKSQRLPAALAVCGLGLGALVISQPQLLSSLRLGFDWPRLQGISGADWAAGAWRAALPQIPLTLLNSVLAVTVLTADLFGPRRAEPGKVALSVGLMNLLFCPFGAMPMCHGAGGIAAQYRFGGRTGGCGVIFGAACIMLAAAFGSSLFVLLSRYPLSVLGVLLICASFELLLVCRDQRGARDIGLMVATAAVCLITNMTVGFLAGLALAGAVWMYDRHAKAGRERSGGDPEKAEDSAAGQAG